MSEDPKVSQRYRELPREEPPQRVDEAILAAARRATESRPAPLVAPTGRRRWYFPVAAAAIIVLAVAVTVHVERQQRDAEVAEAPVVPPAPAREEAASKREDLAADPKPSSQRDDARLADLYRARPGEKPASPPAAPAPQAEAPPGERRAATSVAGAAAQSPEQWLQAIADLRQQGRHDEADRELAQFRKRYPDYRIPDATLEKVEKR